MKKEFCISGVDDKFRLLFGAEGIVRTMSARQMRKMCIRNWDNPNNCHDVYEKEVYAAYKGNRGNFIVFRGFGDPMVCDGVPPTVDSMIEFVIDFDPLADELNEDSKLIVYVTELNGSGTHYDRIYDNKLYNKLLNLNGLAIISKVVDYERRARQRSGQSYDMAIIRNGEYSFSSDPDEINRLLKEMDA